MRILIFCPYYPPHIGGLETHADEFNKYISFKKINVVVFTPRLPKKSPEKETRYNGVEVIRFPAFEIIRNYPLPKFWSFTFWKLFAGLFKRKFDVVISRTRFFNTSILALLYAKIKKIKWMHIEHGSDFVSLNNSLLSKIARFYDYTLGRLVLRLSDYNVANSIASANFCKKLAPKKDCEVIYRGVETEKILNVQPNSSLKNRFPKETIVTFIGRLIDGKGVADLLKAISKIKKTNLICFIIGDGPQRKNLEELAEKLHISDKIIFWGYKKNEEALQMLKMSDIFVNPSLNEGLPSSVIEAALCKKAIIATNVGGTSEIITDKKSGLLIEAGDVNVLKEKILILMENKQLQYTYSNNAFQEVVKKFRWDSSVNRYLDILGRI